MPIGERLRELRESKSLRLEDLEAQARIGGPHLSRVERDLKLPSADALERIVEALEVDASEVDELLEERRHLALAERIQTAGRSEEVDIDSPTAEACAALTRLDEEVRAEVARVTEALEYLDEGKRGRLVEGMRSLLDSLDRERIEDDSAPAA